MIAKINKGSDFKGVISYVMDKKKNAEIIDSSGVRLSSNNERIAQSFIIQSQMNTRVSKCVGHIALSFSKQDADRMTSDFMVEIASKYMHKMGITDTQYIIVRHFYKHPHIHIVFNRVGQYTTISDKNDRYRSEKICKELTMEYGLYFAKGKESVNENRLKEPDKTKYELYSILKREIAHCKCWNALVAHLKENCIDTDFKYKEYTSEIQGVTFTMNGYHFKGSAIDHSMSYSRIDKLLQFNSQHEKENENYSNNTAVGISYVPNQGDEQKQDDISSGISTAKTIVEIPGEIFNLFHQGHAQDDGVSSGELPKKKKKNEDIYKLKR